MIVQADIALQGGHKVGDGSKWWARRTSAIRPSRGRQPLLDVVSCKRSVETVFAGGALFPAQEPAGEFRTVVREAFPDLEGCGGHERLEGTSINLLFCRTAPRPIDICAAF